MSKQSRQWLLSLVVLALVLVCSLLHGMSATSSSEVHLAAGAPVVLNNPDATKTYIAESGSSVTIIRTLGDPNLMQPLTLIARGGSRVWATGTSIRLEAQPGSKAVVSDGVSIDAEGSSPSNITTVHVVGKSKVKANGFTVIYNEGDGEEFAYAGSVTYARSKGRIFAFDGALVYAKSPEHCDACTQVQANPGSTTYVFDGAEAFARGSPGNRANVHVFKGGEVGCFHDCNLILYPQAEFHYGQSCIVHRFGTETDEDTPPPLRNGFKYQD